MEGISEYRHRNATTSINLLHGIFNESLKQCDIVGGSISFNFLFIFIMIDVFCDTDMFSLISIHRYACDQVVC